MLGLRAARQRLTSPDSAISVTLFPMVHAGEAGFFEKVYADAFGHDVVLTEGVRSAIGRHLARSYRWIERSRLGLIVQPPFPAADAVTARIVHADLTGPEFDREWRRVPLHLRLLVIAAVPLVGLRLRWFASRESIGRRLEMDDYRSREETLSWHPEHAALRHSIMDARDARLIETLRTELDRADKAERRLAILFGAAHMRAVLAELGRRHFRSVDSEWLMIFRYD